MTVAKTALPATTAAVPANVAAVMAKVQQIRTELNARYLELSTEIDVLLIGLIGGQHVALLGAKGEGKSALTRAVTGRVTGMKHFATLLSAFSQPEQIYGPLSMKGLENDQYHRKTEGYLPDADSAFLDEAFKANSAILNDMLSILNERLFPQDGKMVQANLQFAVFASNEMPAQELREALWDRVLLRVEVNQLSDDATTQFLQDELTRRRVRAANGDMLGLTVAGDKGTTITKAELKLLQDTTLGVSIGQATSEVLIKIRREIRAKTGRSPSTRRMGWMLSAVCAHAVLHGRVEATEADLAILQHALWDKPEDITKVRTIVLTLANPLMARVHLLADQALQEYRRVEKAWTTKPNTDPTAAVGRGSAKQDPRQDAMAEGRARLQKFGEDIQAIIADLQRDGRETVEAEAIFNTTLGLRHDLVRMSQQGHDSAFSW